MNDIEELIRFYKTFQLLFCFHGEGGRHVEQTISSKQNLSRGKNFQKEDNESERIRTNYPMDQRSNHQTQRGRKHSAYLETRVEQYHRRKDKKFDFAHPCPC